LKKSRKKYQQNYFEHVLGIPSNLIPQKLSDYHPRGTERGVGHQRDGRTNTSNPKTGKVKVKFSPLQALEALRVVRG
jgi:hypothetical protein